MSWSITVDPVANGGAGSARPSVNKHRFRYSAVTFTPATAMPQPRPRSGKYSGGNPHLATIRGCALQVTVEPTTDAGNSWSVLLIDQSVFRADRYPDTEYHRRARLLCHRDSAVDSQAISRRIPLAAELMSAAFLSQVNAKLNEHGGMHS